jgi:hypothetical protein
MRQKIKSNICKELFDIDKKYLDACHIGKANSVIPKLSFLRLKFKMAQRMYYLRSYEIFVKYGEWK